MIPTISILELIVKLFSGTWTLCEKQEAEYLCHNPIDYKEIVYIRQKVSADIILAV